MKATWNQECDACGSGIASDASVVLDLDTAAVYCCRACQRAAERGETMSDDEALELLQDEATLADRLLSVRNLVRGSVRLSDEDTNFGCW